jgi:hypothetical protein
MNAPAKTLVERPEKDAAPSSGVDAAERQEIATAASNVPWACDERGRIKSRRINVSVAEDPAATAVTWHCEPARAMEAFGTGSPEFIEDKLGGMIAVFRQKSGTLDQRALNAALAMIEGLKPQNEAEAALAVQMATTHFLVAKLSARIGSGAIETIRQQDSTALALSRLHRAFTTQMETLSNVRRGGRQKVVVEHVHIHKHVYVAPGAQAIIGDVTHTGRGVADENSEQAHATDDKRAIAVEASAPLRRSDPPRDAVSIASREGQASLSDARGSAGLGSPEGQAQRELSPRLLHLQGNRRTSGANGAHSERIGSLKDICK